MEPSDLYKSRYPNNYKIYDLPGHAKRVVEAFAVLHDIKMLTDEPEISSQSQQLINLLFEKYPNLVPKPDVLQSKNCNS